MADASLCETEIVRGLFGPSIEPILSSHTCSHNINSGRLYIASNALCFYSNMFGFERRLLIPILDITFAGTIKMTSIVIRSKSKRSSSTNKATCVDDDGSDHDGCIPPRLVDGFGNGEDEDITADSNTDADVSPSLSLFQPHEIVSDADKENSEAGEPTIFQGLLMDFPVTEKQQQPPIQKQKQAEETKETIVKEESMVGVQAQQQEVEKCPMQESEDEYIFKSFDDRDYVVKILTALRANLSKNSTIVHPHHQNEGNFGQISRPKLMAALSGKLSTRRRGSEMPNEVKDRHADKDTKEKKRNKKSKKKKKRSSSVPPRSEPCEIQYSSKDLGSTNDKDSANDDNKGYVVDDEADVFQPALSPPPPNRWRCFTTPDWRHDDMSSLCLREIPTATSISTSCPSTIDQDTVLSRSRTSSAEISSQQTSITGEPNNCIAPPHPEYSTEANTTKVTPPPTSSPPSTIVADSSLPLPPPPPKPACRPSDWEKAKESFKDDYKEVAVKTQFLPHSTCESLEAFYDLFLADHAPHSIPAFQENIVGDTSMAIQTWHQQEQQKESATASLSLSPVEQKRTITFSHPRNATLGPSNVHTTKTQICQKFDPLGLILQINTVVKDIPYSDCFVVEEIWIVEAIQGNDDQHSNASDITLSVKFRIRFVKSTMFKKLIINQVRTEVTQWYNSYVKMVMSSLEPRERSVKVDLIGNNDDSAIDNQSVELKAIPNMQHQHQDPSCGLQVMEEKEVVVAGDTSSPVLLSLPPPPSEPAAQEEKGVGIELSSFVTQVFLIVQKTPAPIICFIVVLLWMMLHISSLNHKVESMEEELKVMRIQNAVVMKILTNAISIDSR